MSELPTLSDMPAADFHGELIETPFVQHHAWLLAVWLRDHDVIEPEQRAALACLRESITRALATPGEDAPCCNGVDKAATERGQNDPE